MAYCFISLTSLNFWIFSHDFKSSISAFETLTSLVMSKAAFLFHSVFLLPPSLFLLRSSQLNVVEGTGEGKFVLSFVFSNSVFKPIGLGKADWSWYLGEGAGEWVGEGLVLVDVEVEVVNFGTFGILNYKWIIWFLINEKRTQSIRRENEYLLQASLIQIQEE